MELTGKDRRALRALGHHRKPVVFVGKDGVTDAVVTAVAEAHAGDELIKVRVLDTCEDDRNEVAAALAERTGSALVQVLGRTLLLYRPDPESPEIHLPSTGS